MFQGWESFYVILGTAAGGLIGLLFVVVTLGNSRDRERTLRAVSIYMTPTAVNFGLVLATSAVALAPLRTVMATALVLGAGALTATSNAVWACFAIRAGGPGSAAPHWSDFWLYGVTPLVLCLALVGSDVALLVHAGWASTSIAFLMLGLLLIGIRNAWDLVTWMSAQRNAADPP
jgi:hypothetical protein